LQTLLPFGCERFKEWLLGAKHPNHKLVSKSHPQLVFTTSGAQSTPLTLIPVGTTTCSKRQLILSKRLNQFDSLYSLYQGDFDGEKVVAKLTEEVALGEALRHEASIYNHLSDLQGLVIPTFLGLFVAGSCSLLITSYCGVSLGSFSSLSKAEQ
jgi:hypothetical protein